MTKKYCADDKLEVYVVHATDWCFYGDSSRDIRDNFDPIDGYICGFLLEETEDKVVLAHQVFKESGLVRHVTVVTKSSIIDMYPMKIDDGDEGEEIEDLDLED